MQVIDTINDIDHCLEALRHKLEYVRGCVTGQLYTVDRLLTRKEAADLLCITTRQLDRLCAKNRIKKEVIDGQVRIRRSSVMAYMGIVVTGEKKPSDLSELDILISRFK